MIEGRIRKDTAEVARYTVDLSGWLDTDEVIGSLSRFSLVVDDEVELATAWQVDYPFDTTTAASAVVDTTPLVLTGATITNGTQANILVGAGTPALTYIVSYIATGSTSGRQKQIDFHVTINDMTNENMVSSLDATPVTSVTAVSGSTDLAVGTTGSVFVDNATAGAITVTLPTSPSTGQSIKIVDSGRNAATYAITIDTADGSTINGTTSHVFSVNGQSAEFEWDGTQWIVT